MNPHPQPFAGPGRVNGRSSSARHSGEFRPPMSMNTQPTNGHPAPVPVPPGAGSRHQQQQQQQQQQQAQQQQQPPQSQGGNGIPAAGFTGARSPPNQKNTSHVPCKFYRQGTCQAGKACPFLHTDALAPCKYFQKGNCKFGLKCANEHITADGRRVNKPGGYMMGPGPLNLGGRVISAPGQSQSSSLLTMQQDSLAQPQPIPVPNVDYMNRDVWKTDNLDSNFASLPKSNWGSPTGDGNLPMSPPLRGLTAANAQLPASFDSQGISKFARDGPFAASVPSRFLVDQSPPSRPIESSALRNLHSSAFGDDHANGKLGLPSSPPADEPIGRRILHSERYSRNPRMISASVGAPPPLVGHDEWDDNFGFEEDMVPNSLHELLTPHERARRLSRTADDETRQALSGLGTPADSASKVGSPSTASPSRFSGFWAGRKDVESSPFGPVGSPLKSSSLHPGASPSLRATANARPISGELSQSISSPPRQSSMSMISQQLQRNRLSDRVINPESSNSPLQHPGIQRVASGSSVGTAPNRLDRAVSSSSVNRDKIDEEPEELFSMDEIGKVSLDDTGGFGSGAFGSSHGASASGGVSKENAWRRTSGGAWNQGNPFSLGKSSPRVGPIGGQRTSSVGAVGTITKPDRKIGEIGE